jgi:PAS domain S-box-containing protein
MSLDADIYRELFAVDPRPMWLFERQTRRFLLVNEAAIRDYGWSREEWLAMRFDDMRPAEERAAFEALWAASPFKTTQHAITSRHWKKSGERMDVDLQVSRLVYQGRDLTLVIATTITGIADVERRFRLLVENSAEAIVVSREDYVVEYVSPAGERLLGRPSSELVGKTSHDRVHPDDVGAWKPPPPFGTTTHVARTRHRDGSWRWIESVTTNLLRDPAVRAYVTNYRDITRHREAEAAKAETQRRLEYLLSATSAVTYVARADGELGATFISANVEQLLGYRPEQFTGNAAFWFEHLHPDDRAGVQEGLRQLHEHGEQTLDYRFRHADGSWRFTRDTARLVRNADGEPVETVGYWIDVTEQSEAQESLRRSEANFRALIERSRIATYVHRDGVIVYANPAAVALFGYGEPAGMVGLEVLDLVHPEDHEAIRQRMQHAVECGATPPREGRKIRRDGSVFFAEVEALRLEFDGELSSVVFARDVTERREMFARMAIADRMLTVGTLAAGVAHEVNNPLAFIATNLEILASDLPRLIAKVPTRVPAQDLPALVADARDGVARVSAIVRDLRALAKPEDDARGPVDLAGVLASSIRMAYSEIRHRATVVESYAPGLPPVDGNASRLGQVFLNLLINAAQAIPEGHATANEIRVRVTGDLAQVTVEIEDTGAGIPAAILRRIFDPFFTTKEPGVGMGLGLAICHQIVSAMDGQIYVESKPGFGSTFRVRLPVAGPRLRSDAPAIAAPAIAGARILLVDDEIAVGRSLCALLAGDHEVVPVTRARDALERIRGGEHFDVILCDLMMPDVSGIELYSQMSAEERERIVFMTGGAFTPQTREFLAKIDRPRLDKPFSEHELREAIERVTGTKVTP